MNKDKLKAHYMARLTDLFTKPATQTELCQLTGLRQAVVSRYLRVLLDAEPRGAHIGDWRRAKGSGPPVAIYSPGPGEDVECTIRAFSVKERVRRFRDRKVKAAEELERKQAEAARREWRPPGRDFLTECLFGQRA
jgi:hypothetical protein